MALGGGTAVGGVDGAAVRHVVVLERQRVGHQPTLGVVWGECGSSQLEVGPAADEVDASRSEGAPQNPLVVIPAFQAAGCPPKPSLAPGPPLLLQETRAPSPAVAVRFSPIATTFALERRMWKKKCRLSPTVLAFAPKLQPA